MIITPQQLKDLDRDAYDQLLDTDEDELVLYNDDRIEATDGRLTFYTRGGDPGCQLDDFGWQPNTQEWIALADLRRADG